MNYDKLMKHMGLTLAPFVKAARYITAFPVKCHEVDGQPAAGELTEGQYLAQGVCVEARHRSFCAPCDRDSAGRCADRLIRR